MAEMIELKEQEERVILVAVSTGEDDDTAASVDELEELASTAGVTVGKVIQNRENVHPGTYLGKGKIEEVKELLWELDATGIICDDELSPAQLKNLEDALDTKVMDRTRERARIFFTEPTHRRQVKIVDWLDDAGQVRLSEHYNRYGAIFCHTIFNKKGQKALRKFFDVAGREIIMENFVTGDILVRWQDKDWIFRSKTDFIAFFIRCAGLEDTAVYFNSLSYPFFASQALAPNGFRDALFWHEPVGDEIPGNMQIILHDQGTRAKRVFVSRRESYDRLIALGAPSDKVKQLGYIYSFVRENKHRPHILVCTNSENVGHLTELASLMPQMHFHVAAITEMSSKLMSAGQYDNVSLYPNVKMSVLDSLFEKCDFYLDINHEGEIVDAVHRAFLNNMLIVGYEETMHNAYYTADTNTFKESEYADMAEALNLTLAMPHLIDEALAMQKKAAVAADATDYMEILHL